MFKYLVIIDKKTLLTANAPFYLPVEEHLTYYFITLCIVQYNYERSKQDTVKDSIVLLFVNNFNKQSTLPQC